MSPEDSSTASSSRAPVPEGTVSVAVGLFINGISTYVFFKIGQQALGQDGFKPIVTMWFIAFALVPGFFLPIEQETSRALAHRRALGQGGLPVIKRIIPLAAMIFGGLLVALAIATKSVTNNLFEPNATVTLALLLMLLTYAPMHIARGLSSGQGKFSNYALIIGLDGTIRVVVCAALWLSGIENTGVYAVAVGLSPIVGVILVAIRGDLRLHDGPPASWSEITPNLGWLLLGSLFAAALVNAGPITVDGILTDAAWRTSRPVSGFVQQKPVEGQPAEYQTEVAVVYDDEALYVAAHMYDPAPACPEPGWQEVREFFCPDCASQLAVEVVAPGYPVVLEMLPDLDKFYREYLGQPLPDERPDWYRDRTENVTSTWAARAG